MGQETPMSHELRILDSNGDTKYQWDTPEEAQAVEKVFKDMQSKGYTAAQMMDDGSQGTMIREFDASARSLLMLPPLRGG